MPTDSNCGKWSAIHDFMPPRPGRLNVTGECTFPTPGFKVALKKKQPQGINPAILILEKSVVTPTGIEPQILTVVPVEYHETTDYLYTEVEILPDATFIPIQNVQ